MQANGVVRGHYQRVQAAATQSTRRHVGGGCWCITVASAPPGFCGGVLLTQTRAPAMNANQGANASAAAAVWVAGILHASAF